MTPTSRELAVLEAVARAGSCRGAAVALDVAESTVKNHLRAVHRKLGCRSSWRCYEIALERGLIIRSGLTPKD